MTINNYHNYNSLNDNFSTNVSYAFTVAKIDSEDKGSGSVNGKTHPMTSKHNISVSAMYSLNDKANMTLTQKYRSKGFASEDLSIISRRDIKPWRQGLSGDDASEGMCSPSTERTSLMRASF